MTPDMAELLAILLGCGGTVTAGTWYALPFHHTTKYALENRGLVVPHLLFRTKRSKYVTPTSQTRLYFQEDGPESMARVYFVTDAGRAALGEYHADRAAGDRIAEAGRTSHAAPPADAAS